MNETVPNYYIESEYISMYPDIADAVRDGVWSSGAAHYIVHGRAEGRQTYRFDEAFYLRSYPLARREVDDGLAVSPREHYEKFGCNRGYLPHATSPRPDNPTAAPSRFGGLWIDQPNARDIVAGRHETGHISEELAQQLTFFIDNGYVVIDGAIPEAQLVPALDALEQAYSGEIANLLFECNAVVNQHSPFQPAFVDKPSKALDIHWFSDAIRDLVFSERINRFLELLFDARPFASQSLGFYRGSAQEAHQDSAFVPYTLQRGFVASWIALEDVEAGAGELFYYVGSHRFGDYLYDNQYKSVSEAVRAGVPQEAANEMVGPHVSSLPVRAKEQDLPERTFIARRGDALIWHADLAHGGKPISTARSRKSVVTHYSGKYSAPLFAERIATPLREHKGRGFYTTSHYPSRPPENGRVRAPAPAEPVAVVVRPEPARAAPVGMAPVGMAPVGMSPVGATPVVAEPATSEPVRAQATRTTGGSRKSSGGSR